MLVRRIAYNMGYRYRLHKKNLPGRPDMTFHSRKKVIFVHGCFWHQHTSRACKLAHRPRSNLSYWEPKLRRNKERDQQHLIRLREAGWRVLTLWECEILQARPEQLRARLYEFLDGNLPDQE